MFVTLKLPQRIADDLVFRYAVQCIACAEQGYVPPKRRFIGGAGLKKVRQKMEVTLAPVVGSWKRDWVTVLSDMMTDRCGCPQANVLLVNNSGAVFEQAVNCHRESKTGEYIASLLRPVIDKAGSENVVAVCTDGGSNYASAAKKIAGTLPHIEHVPCATHVLYLMMEDVGKMGWAKGLVEKAGEMITFVRNHHWEGVHTARCNRLGSAKYADLVYISHNWYKDGTARLCPVTSPMPMDEEEDEMLGAEIEDSVLADEYGEGMVVEKPRKEIGYGEAS
ncbi:unnamed protein product [Closterium sp. Naga37s-1]|nr:unnamed protein product [Closterium sp. Naga37s-1]